MTTYRWMWRPGTSGHPHQRSMMRWQRQRAPFGFATKKSESWTYNISPGLLIKYKRGDLPTYRLEEIIELAAEGVGRVVDAKLELVDRLLKVVSLAS